MKDKVLELAGNLEKEALQTIATNAGLANRLGQIANQLREIAAEADKPLVDLEAAKTAVVGQVGDAAAVVSGLASSVADTASEKLAGARKGLGSMLGGIASKLSGDK